MRQLRHEGWMHNRARLIVGSFLTKTLLHRLAGGRAALLDHLVDGDVANNQLNWQWVAGTGTDSRPNRAFNPAPSSAVRPGRRLRPPVRPRARGPRRAPVIHQPWKLPREERALELDYPQPLVDLAEARDRMRKVRSQTT